MSDLKRALEIDPYNIDAIRARAKVRVSLKQYDMALSDFATVIAARPHDWDCIQTVWRSPLRDGKLPGGHRLVLQGIGDHPTGWGLYTGCGDAHFAMGNYRAAIDLYSRGLEINPKRWHLYKRRAEAYSHLGEHARALDDLTKGLEGNPADPSTLTWISAAQLAQTPEDFRQGLLKLAQSVIDRSPTPASAYAARGALHMQLKDYENAEADFAQAVRLDPDSADAWAFVV